MTPLRFSRNPCGQKPQISGIVPAGARFGTCLPWLNPRGLRAMRTVSFRSSPARRLCGTPSPKTTFTLPGSFGSDAAQPMINRVWILQVKFSRHAGRLPIPPAPAIPNVTCDELTAPSQSRWPCFRQAHQNSGLLSPRPLFYGLFDFWPALFRVRAKVSEVEPVDSKGVI